MELGLFDYHLPEERIAQYPLSQREASRLLVLDRQKGVWHDRFFAELADLLLPGDLLVLNDTRVIPARLRGRRERTGGQVEFLLLPTAPPLEPPSPQPEKPLRVRTLLRSGGRLFEGERFDLAEGRKAVLRKRYGAEGDLIEIGLNPEEWGAFLARNGEVPLPPYIHRPPGASSVEDQERYQTIFARKEGAVAAPTAGLHFSAGLLAALEKKGIATAFITLHVGPGTFRPVKEARIEEHRMDPEFFEIGEETARAVTTVKKAGRRVIPVGSTAMRTLESQWDRPQERLKAGSGFSDLFIHPPFSFRVSDALITNFHLPKSTLLMLAAAFADPGGTDGARLVLKAYEHAKAAGYRFFSYGDACLFR